jgi:hypothetical protein
MTGTPLERHREANADAGALAAIRERIEASGVEYVEHLERCRPIYQKVIGCAQALEFQMYAEAAP